MAKIGIIRCEKNETRCPLTGCINSLNGTVQGFDRYDQAQLMGVFTCRCPGDNVSELGKILKSKGAEAIHFCTCTFARKEAGEWVSGKGFCDNVDALLQRVAEDAGLPCVKGSAHLPQGYRPESF
jgi:predicted metal-binding protein